MVVICVVDQVVDFFGVFDEVVYKVVGSVWIVEVGDEWQCLVFGCFDFVGCCLYVCFCLIVYVNDSFVGSGLFCYCVVDVVC